MNSESIQAVDSMLCVRIKTGLVGKKIPMLTSHSCFTREAGTRYRPGVILTQGRRYLQLPDCEGKNVDLISLLLNNSFNYATLDMFTNKSALIANAFSVICHAYLMQRCPGLFVKTNPLIIIRTSSQAPWIHVLVTGKSETLESVQGLRPWTVMVSKIRPWSVKSE